MRLTILALAALSFTLVQAQQSDTLYITIQQADSIFLNRNLLLLSGQYNVDIREALIIQAKAYPNPVFTASVNAVDPEHRQLFNVGQQGQKEFDLQQLIILGGKRKTGIQQAMQSREIAIDEFAELLRNLRFQLHSSFYVLNKHRRIIAAYDHQMSLLSQIISSYEEQAVKGNIPMKDVIRLKTIYLGISNEKLEARNAQAEEVKKLQILFRTRAYPVPVVDESVLAVYQRLPAADSLLSLALDNRPDLRATNAQMDLAQTNLKLQKQLVIPDAILNVGYDQRGGAFRNQLNVGVALPLPTFDRNRGNIRAAHYGQMNAELMRNQKLAEVESETLLAWQNMESAIKEYSSAARLYTQDFTAVFDGMNDNFRRRNLSILEFVDFFEAYNESLATIERLKTQLAIAAEQVNFTTATTIYP